MGLAGPAGEAGPMGLMGPMGPIGAAGPAGPKGDKGDAGPAGAAGPQGEVGPAGPAGAQGAVGPQGPQGEQGPAGPAGSANAWGLSGAQSTDPGTEPGQNYLGTADAKPLILATSATAAMVIDEHGHAAIGTAPTQASLTVGGYLLVSPEGIVFPDGTVQRTAYKKKPKKLHPYPWEGAPEAEGEYPSYAELQQQIQILQDQVKELQKQVKKQQ